jgi:hypothetical protein
MTLAVTDEDNYYDLATSNVVNIASKSSSTWQVQLLKKKSDNVWEFKIVNL